VTSLHASKPSLKPVVAVVGAAIIAWTISAPLKDLLGLRQFSAPGKGEHNLVVATRTLIVGTMIRPKDVLIGAVSSAAYPSGGYSNVEDVLDRPIVLEIRKGEPILETHLASKGSGLGLAPTIPVGMRAIAISVDEIGSVDGYVFPGMKVDALVTAKRPGTNDSITNTILQNLLVLSVGDQMVANLTVSPIHATSLTLLADPQQAEILTAADLGGKIRLTLRNSSDQSIENTAGASLIDLLEDHPGISTELQTFRGTLEPSGEVKNGAITFTTSNASRVGRNVSFYGVCEIFPENSDGNIEPEQLETFYRTKTPEILRKTLIMPFNHPHSFQNNIATLGTVTKAAKEHKVLCNLELTVAVGARLVAVGGKCSGGTIPEALRERKKPIQIELSGFCY
jgi:pilus assembly protein CpaB